MTHSDDTVPASPAWTHREEVLLAGSAIGSDAEATVDQGLDDPDPKVRVVALGGLIRQGRLNAATLSHALADPDPTVKIRAAQLSGHVGLPCVPALLGLIPGEVGVEIACLVAIADLGATDAVDFVMAVARATEEPLVLEEAVATLGALGVTEGLDVVLEATTGRPALRRRAVAALGAFEGPSVEEALDRLAEDRDWQVRQAVAMLRRPPLDGS